MDQRAGAMVGKQILLATFVSGAVVVGRHLVRRYRLDEAAADGRRLDKADRTSATARFGLIDSVDTAAGSPPLGMHGIFGGSDGALRTLRGCASGPRIVASSERLLALASGRWAGHAGIERGGGARTAAALIVESCSDAISRWWRSPTAKKALLLAPIAAVGAYAVGDLVCGLLYDGYSFKNQAISELSAFGSPVRPLMVPAIMIHNVLLLVFGVGLLRVAQRRSLRWIGLLQVAEFVVVGIATHTFWAMSSRDMATGFNDTMHYALSAVFSLIVVAMMVLSAVTYPGWFRIYSVATMIVVTGFGIGSFVAMRGLDLNNTPWAGGFERINAYAYFAWLIVLAITVIRRELAQSRSAGGTSSRRPTPLPA